MSAAVSSSLEITPFWRSMVFVAAHEAGFADDPDDPGGATYIGVTQGTYAAWYAKHGLPVPGSVRDAPIDVLIAIYHQNYWLDGTCDRVAEVRPLVALALFDAGVNMGIVQAAKCLQRALGVTADGMIGPATLAALANAGAEDLEITTFLEQRARVYRVIAERRAASRKFLGGWLARLRWVARACATAITTPFAGSS